MIETTPKPGHSRAADGPSDEEIEDAWDQYDEEIEEQSATDIDRETSVASESLDDIYRDFLRGNCPTVHALKETTSVSPTPSFGDFVAKEQAKEAKDKPSPQEPEQRAGENIARTVAEARPQSRRSVTARQYQQATKFQVGSEIDEAGLSPIEFRIYAHLVRRADTQFHCFPSISHICAQCRCRRSTAVEAIRTLEERKFISSQRQYHRPTIYTLRPPQDWSNLTVG